MFFKKIARKSCLFILLAVFFILVFSNEQAKAGGYNLTFAVSGVVSSVNVKVGDKVKVGTVLAVLDLTPFTAAKRAAKATLDLAKLILTQSEVKLEQAQKLFNSLSTSGEELENAIAEHARALSGYEVAKTQVEITTWHWQQATLKSPFDGIVAATPGYPGIVINNDRVNIPIIVINKK